MPCFGYTQLYMRRLWHSHSRFLMHFYRMCLNVLPWSNLSALIEYQAHLKCYYYQLSLMSRRTRTRRKSAISQTCVCVCAVFLSFETYKTLCFLTALQVSIALPMGVSLPFPQSSKIHIVENGVEKHNFFYASPISIICCMHLLLDVYYSKTSGSFRIHDK